MFHTQRQMLKFKFQDPKLSWACSKELGGSLEMSLWILWKVKNFNCSKLRSLQIFSNSSFLAIIVLFGFGSIKMAADIFGIWVRGRWVGDTCALDLLGHICKVEVTSLYSPDVKMASEILLSPLVPTHLVCDYKI